MFVAAALWILISALTARVVGDSPVLPVALAFVAVSAVLIPIDLRARRLPRLVLLTGLMAVAAVQLAVAISIDEPGRMLGAFGGMTLSVVALAIAHHAAPDGVGFGDAAFAAFAGGTLGWLGADRVILGLGLGLVLAAVAAGPITLAVRRDRLVMSPGIALRPAIAAGTWVAICWGEVIVAAYGP
jgi:prepilin signal peptidase PulO-like enzyme (type II secretory pathway)